MFAVVVIGPPGSGKTSVLTALHDVLADRDAAHAVIEVEAVAWAHPPLGDGQSFRHLESLCRMYEAAGCQLVVVGATATSADYLAAVLAAVAANDYLVVRLEADASTLRKRIIAREPAEWSGLPRLLDAADEIALVSRSLEDVHLVCSTEDASPLAVATQIRKALPEVLGGMSSGVNLGSLDEQVVPVLYVEDAPRAVAWYERLGFHKEWEHQFEPGFPWFVSVARGPARLYLSEHKGDARPDTLIHLYVNDIDAVSAEFDVPVDEEGLAGRECALEDPDGNRLRVATPRS